MIKNFNIGKHTIDEPVVLAPMAGVTDRPFRQLCKSLGASLAVSEMVGANSLLHGSEKTKRRANHDGETRPCSVQIVGADPEKLAMAAKINADEGADIIDINMGCPAKKVCNTLSGSALMRDEPLVERILTSVVKAVDIPVTLKIRTGWDKSSRNGPIIAKMAQDAGIQALAVHGRTRCCMYKGDAEYETIARIKQAVTIPVIANGDIQDGRKALEVLKQTGADGIMIGRAAQGRPWIFNHIRRYLRDGVEEPEPEATQIAQWMLGHLKNLYAFYGEHRGVLIARKHVSWYSKGQRGGNAFRQHFNQLQSAEEQYHAAQSFFAELAQA